LGTWGIPQVPFHITVVKNINFVYYNFRFLSILLFTLVSCSSDNSTTEEGPVKHPQKENYPYTQVNHYEVDTTQSAIDISNLRKLNQIQAFLDSSSSSIPTAREVPVQISRFENLLIKPISRHRLIFIDTETQDLFEYNQPQDTVYQLAEYGRGPGKLSSSKELSYNNGKLMIPMSSGRISLFNCQTTPCNFEEEKRLEDLIIYSADMMDDGSFVALGNAPIRDKSDTLRSEALHTFNNNGNYLNSFAETYDTEGHWMLRRPLSEGIVKYNPPSEQYVLAFERLPFVYILDNDFNRVRSYKFNDFIVGQQKYWPQEGRLKIVMSDHSLIKDMVFFDDFALVKINTKKNQEVVGKRFVWDRESTYYLLDLNNNRATFFGNRKVKSKKSSKRIDITNQGILKSNLDKLEWLAF